MCSLKKKWCAIIGILCSINIHAYAQYTYHNMVLSGQCNGGELSIAHIHSPDAKFLTIQTTSGESAESVVSRLADGIIVNDPFEWRVNTNLTDETFGIYAQGNELYNLPGLPMRGRFIFAGTETGLGIPDPPKHVSANYNATSNSITVFWGNPAIEYDSISVVLSGICKKLPGTTTSHEFDIDIYKLHLNGLYIKVVGYINDIPSNAGAIRLYEDRQKEAYNLPFTNSILPNWEAWSNGLTSDTMQLEQVLKDDYRDKDRRLNPVESPRQKALYQEIRPTTDTAVCGVFRKFLGLTPGHTYRIGTRVNTLDLDTVSSDSWKLSVHAAYNAATGENLSVDQLCGLAALPDGSSGEAAGRIAQYESGKTTNGEWEFIYSDYPNEFKEIGNITLPDGIDTITVWLRHSGSGGNMTGVGLDWLIISDESQ